MKEAIWAYLILILGVTVVAIVTFVQRVTTTAEEDFHLGREVMQSAMTDSIDYATYRTSGRIVMSEQKFVETFIRRFAESVTNNKEYTLDFYDIYEEPPKATVRIKTNSGQETTINMDSSDTEIDTLLSAILETPYEQYMAQLEDSEKQARSGKYTTKRYINGPIEAYKNLNKTGEKITIPTGSVVSLVLSEYLLDNSLKGDINEQITNDLNMYSCNYNDHTYCKIYYNGEAYYIDRSSLSYSPNMSDTAVGEFDINYKAKKICAAETINGNNTKVVDLQALQLNDDAKAYKEANTNSKLNAEYGKCSILNVVGKCDSSVDFCELYDGGGYIKSKYFSTNVEGCVIPTDNSASGNDALIDTDGVITDNDTIYYHSQQIILVNNYEDGEFILNDNPSFIYSMSNDGWYGSDPEKNNAVDINAVSVPERSGYVFGGYYTEMNGEGYMVINNKGEIVNTIAHENSYDYFLSDSFVFAYWTTDPKSRIYEIKLDKQNGSGGLDKIYEVYGSRYTSDAKGNNTLKEVTIPSREHYSFGGYYTGTNGGTRYINKEGYFLSSNASTTHFTANGSLYARWIGNLYKVTLDKNGGTGGTSTIYEKYGTDWYNSNNESLASIKIPTLTGKNFLGYFDENGNKIINEKGEFLAGKTTTLSKDDKLYAHWEDAIVCGKGTDAAIEKCKSNGSGNSDDSLCYKKSTQMTTIFIKSNDIYQAGVIYGNASFKIIDNKDGRTQIAVKVGTKGVNSSLAEKCNNGSSYYCVWIHTSCLVSSNKACCSAN